MAEQAIPFEPLDDGLRARTKAERRRRIEAAARAVFGEKGFEAATTREIAERAGVGKGTLFGYVRDKDDLLRMVFRDELEALTARTFDALTAKRPLLDELVGVFRARYLFWAKDRRLARHAARLSFAEYGQEGDAIGARTDAVRSQLLTRMRDFFASRGVAGDADPELAASIVYAVYVAEHRAWLNDDASVDEGVARLRAVLALALRGILPGKAAR